MVSMKFRLVLQIWFLSVVNLTTGNDIYLHLNDSIYVQPQQLHLSISDDTNSFVVTWSSVESTETPRIGGSWVEYGTNPRRLDKISDAQESKFVDGGSEHATQFIHRAVMGPLSPSTVYYYRVGCNITMSSLYLFRSFPIYDSTLDNWSPHIAIYGDMGNTNAQSLPRLQREAQEGMYDMVIHVGDFAYNMDTENARVGDEFMRQIESIAAYTPYMTCPGNHESAYNFSNYKARFTMPEENKADQDKNMFYSFNLGPIHFISINTEYYYYMDQPWNFQDCVIRQYIWLYYDLKEANRPENRKLRPWIILFGHRPMYCTGADKDDCTVVTTKTRVGSNSPYIPNTEKLLRDYKVDVAIWAHEHNYERFWPMYNFTVMNGTTNPDEPYTDAGATLHMITGSAGCQERKENFKPEKPYYSAFRENDYGYTRLKAHNKTHIEFSQVSDDKNGEILDNFFLIKNFHARADGEEEEATQIHSDPSSHHYSLRPHYELLRRINQNHQGNTTNELYPFPLIEIISG